MNLIITPFKGYAQVILGMTRDEVEAQIGEPDEVFEEIIDGMTEMVINYKSIGANLSFSSEHNYRLGSISIYHPDCLINEIQLIESDEGEFLIKSKQAGIEDFEIESTDPDNANTKDYYSDALGISVEIEDGIVEMITVYPQYDEEDEESIIWPS